MSATSTNVVVISNVPDIHGLIHGTRNIDLSTESSQHEAIATMNISGLEALLQKLGLSVPIPPFPSADVLNIPLDIGRSYFADILCSLIGCDAATAYNSIQLPNSVDNGDLAVILPRLSHGDSEALGFTIKQNFPQCPLFDLPFVDGVHLRIMFRQQTLPRLLFPYINDRKNFYGRHISLGLRDPSSPDLGRKKIVVEFSSPNIASEFHAKHLRSTILGAYIANLYETMGWDVVKINYLGDWGMPIGLLGVGWEKLGSEEKFKADPVGHLHEVNHEINKLFEPEQAARKNARVEGHNPADIEAQGLFAERNAFFKRMEDGDEKAIQFWKRVREVNIANYTELYSRLNVSFDEYSGESQVSSEAMAEVEEILKSKGLCEIHDDSWAVDLKKHTGRAGMAIIRNRTGSSTYLLRELAAVLDRFKKYSFDEMIYVVVADTHTTHFSRLSKVLELMDKADLAKKLRHVHFSEVSQMSEQLGYGHTLDEILNQCQTAMRTSLKENPDKAALLGDTDEAAASIGFTALLAQELSARRSNDHTFDINRMTSFSQGTGPNLQWWYVRLCSILKTTPAPTDLSEEELASFNNMDQATLLRLLAQYPDITLQAYKSLEPATILAYLVTVVGQLSSCLEDSPEETGITPAQARLYESTRIVLENGMKLLGITPAVK